MGKWEIAKEFGFAYGHRVWSQELDARYSLDACLACRHFHGHQGTLMVYLSADKLSNGMVIDFKTLGWLKKWIDDVLDHKFIIDRNDPIFPYEFPELDHNPPQIIDRFDPIIENKSIKPNYQIFDPEWVTTLPKPLQEKYEGITIVDFVPTSENLARWLHGIIQEVMKPLGVKVSRVQLFETPKSQANYYAE